MSEHDLFTAILLAIGPWAFDAKQAEYIVLVHRQHMGRETDTVENFYFLQRYISFCEKNKP